MTIMAKELAAIGAEGKECGEAAVLLAAVTQILKMAGGEGGDERQQEKMTDRRPEGREAHHGGQKASEIGGRGPEVVEGEADGEQEGEQAEVAAGGADEPGGTGKGHKNPHHSAPAADRPG